MPPSNLQRIGSLAAQKGWITDGQLKECVQIQRQLADQGKIVPLGEILYRKKYLTKEQIQAILKAQQKPPAAPPPPQDPVIAGSVPGYRVEKLLGRGGMGSVYLAVQTNLNRKVALKVVQRGGSQGEFVERFKREAFAAARLNHPNLVQVYDAGQQGDLIYYAMELVEGKSLAELVEPDRALPPRRALAIVREAAQALKYAHAQGVIHRDIKPDNILITPDGHVKLADLGLAKVEDPAMNRLTQSGIVMGTPHYMSPEQALDSGKVDARSDLYSLGATFYRLIAGRPPHDGDTPVQVLVKIQQEPVVPPRERVPGLPAAYDETILKMMAAKPEDRYQNAGELLARLDALAKLGDADAETEGLRSRAPTISTDAHPAPPSPPAPPAAMASARRFPRKALIAAACVACLAAVAGALAVNAWSHRDPSPSAPVEPAEPAEPAPRTETPDAGGHKPGAQRKDVRKKEAFQARLKRIRELAETGRFAEAHRLQLELARDPQFADAGERDPEFGQTARFVARQAMLGLGALKGEVRDLMQDRKRDPALKLLDRRAPDFAPFPKLAAELEEMRRQIAGGGR